MKVVKGFPPNIERIKAILDISNFNPVFTYKDTIYNPTGLPIPEDLVAHEETHERQQAVIGAEKWWDNYLLNPEFRLAQEAAAYRQQYVFMKTKYNRKFRLPYLNEYAKNLSSELYGNLINFNQAKEIINGQNTA